MSQLHHHPAVAQLLHRLQATPRSVSQWPPPLNASDTHCSQCSSHSGGALARHEPLRPGKGNGSSSSLRGWRLGLYGKDSVIVQLSRSKPRATFLVACGFKLATFSSSLSSSEPLHSQYSVYLLPIRPCFDCLVALPLPRRRFARSPSSPPSLDDLAILSSNKPLCPPRRTLACFLCAGCSYLK